MYKEHDENIKEAYTKNNNNKKAKTNSMGGKRKIMYNCLIATSFLINIAISMSIKISWNLIKKKKLISNTFNEKPFKDLIFFGTREEKNT